MPKKFDDCVKGIKKQGKNDDSAYAICVAQYKKDHDGKSPFSKKEDILESDLPQKVKRIALLVFEAEQAGKKVKVLESEVTGRAL